MGQSVSQWVIDNCRFGDSYRISEFCELVGKERDFYSRILNMISLKFNDMICDRIFKRPIGFVVVD